MKSLIEDEYAFNTHMHAQQIESIDNIKVITSLTSHESCTMWFIFQTDASHSTYTLIKRKYCFIQKKVLYIQLSKSR